MKTLHFIHIGKCGGSSLQEAIKLSPVVQNYEKVFRSHVGGFKFVENCDYLIVIRNPIERAISAFSWRKKLVVLDEHPEQVVRFPGEREILNRYSFAIKIRFFNLINPIIEKTMEKDSIEILFEKKTFILQNLVMTLPKL